MDLAERLEDTAKSRAFLSWNMNVAASGPQQRRLRAALARDDLFSVVIELFPTDTADLADIVLPAASFLEFDDIVTSYFNLVIGAQAKAQEPIGESLPNQEIFRRLAVAMGFNEPELVEADEAIIANLVAAMGVDGGFAALKEKGTVPAFDEPFIAFDDLAFPTPSGRIEIASARAEADGLPRVPQSGADARPTDGRLRLLSPASVWLMNDSYGNDDKVLEQLGPVTVALHPDDAAERGLAAGDAVRMSNEIGALAVTLEVSDIVPRGAALSHKGRWPKREDAGINVNALNPGIKTDMGESTCVHSVEVEVSAA